MDGNNSLYDLYLAAGKGFVVTSSSFDTNPVYLRPPIGPSTINPPLLYHNEESVDFSELVEACEKNLTPPAPISGSDCSSACCLFEEKPFPFDKILPMSSPMYNEEPSPYCVPPPPSSTSHDFVPHESPSLPLDGILTSTPHFSLPHPMPNIPTSAVSTSRQQPAARQSRSTAKQAKKIYNKSSEEYRDKRERNNVAVRKSRNKMKLRAQETERRVHELEEENTALQNQVSLLLKELKVLKGLLTSADGIQQPQVTSNIDAVTSQC